MQEIGEMLELLNHWWKTKKVNKNLSPNYKRKIFTQVIKTLNKKQIVILTGLRRIGKTTLMYQTIEHLIKNKNPLNIIYFNLDKRVSELTGILDSYQNLTNVNWKKEKIYFFIDEISKLKEWGSKIKLLYDAFPNIKFFVSSSSSVGLEEEAIKNLSGRYFMLKMTPLSFAEFLELKNKKEYIENQKLWEKEIQTEFKKYKLRSFPEIINWKDELLIKDYLRTMIIDKIVRQDLIEKFSDVNRELLFKLLELFYSEPGFYLNYDNLAKDLKISKKTLYHHIFFLEFSYLIKIIKNFRINTLSTSRKLQRVYAYWWNLAYCYSDNEDKIMENLIASQPSIKNYWKEYEKEVDFLIIKKKKIIPLEVKNKTKIRKEDLKHLVYFLEKNKINEGIVIYTGKEKVKNKKIKYIPLWKWLLQ